MVVGAGQIDGAAREMDESNKSRSSSENEGGRKHGEKDGGLGIIAEGGRQIMKKEKTKTHACLLLLQPWTFSLLFVTMLLLV